MPDRETTQAPTTADEARELLIAQPLPEALMTVARTLHDAGHEAVLVGGAVRDCLLGRSRGDWDLATSATPDEVTKLFRKTIPTGVEHGTVTVVLGKGKRRVVTEVTTFRGEGDYIDGRRPSEVRFLRELEADLARRDFTVNAFAWNPLTRVFTDCFDGLGDLNGQLIRAVGDPVARFGEDGLRAMRAVRFCAALGFRLDPSTRDAIGGALEILAKVSRERVRVELIKLLASPRPSLGLTPMAETGMWPIVLGELDPDARAAAIAAVDRIGADAPGPDPIVRLARLLWPRRDDRAGVEAAIDGLKPSRDERRRVLALTLPERAGLATLEDPVEIRRLLRTLGGREHLEDSLDLLEVPAAQRQRVAAALEGAAVTTGELAIKGGDLVKSGIVKPGRAIGFLLNALLVHVVETPADNTRERLLELAKERLALALALARGAS